MLVLSGGTAHAGHPMNLPVAGAQSHLQGGQKRIEGGEERSGRGEVRDPQKLQFVAIDAAVADPC